jgi:hypothetical protein
MSRCDVVAIAEVPVCANAVDAQQNRAIPRNIVRTLGRMVAMGQRRYGRGV